MNITKTTRRVPKTHRLLFFVAAKSTDQLTQLAIFHLSEVRSKIILLQITNSHGEKCSGIDHHKSSYKNNKIKLGKIESLIKVLKKFYVYTNSSNYNKYSKIHIKFTKRTTLNWQMKVKLHCFNDDASQKSHLVHTSLHKLVSSSNKYLWSLPFSISRYSGAWGSNLFKKECKSAESSIVIFACQAENVP